MRFLRLLGVAICAPVLLYLGAALIGGLITTGKNLRHPGGETQVIYLLRGPIHYDYLLPLSPAVRAHFDWLPGTGIDMAHPEARWLVVGWGARDFYTTVGGYGDVTPRAIWRGLTGDSAVMRVSAAGAIGADWPVERLAMTSGQFDSLLDGVTGSFAQGALTAALPYPGHDAFDRFYPARGRFHVFRTCNTWIGRTLRAAGVPFGVWTPTPYAVTLSARRSGG